MVNIGMHAGDLEFSPFTPTCQWQQRASGGVCVTVRSKQSNRPVPAFERVLLCWSRRCSGPHCDPSPPPQLHGMTAATPGRNGKRVRRGAPVCPCLCSATLTDTVVGLVVSGEQDITARPDTGNTVLPLPAWCGGGDGDGLCVAFCRCVVGNQLRSREICWWSPTFELPPGARLCLGACALRRDPTTGAQRHGSVRGALRLTLVRKPRGHCPGRQWQPCRLRAPR